ncbi:MAG: rhomboid family intramembrane serine protease [Actinomycetota bacterium]
MKGSTPVTIAIPLWDDAPMTEAPTGSTMPATDEAEQTYCYGHPKTPTKLRCSRCERPICGQCAIPASVGQHCPECVAEARRSAPRVRTVLRASAPAVMAIIVINVVVYAAQAILGPEFTFRYASFTPAIVAGEWWRLFTAMFLHSPNSIIHILFNMYVLYIYGPNVEQAFGTVRFVVLYAVSGLVASSASAALGPCAVPSVGASGAIFGLIGILVVYLYNRRESPQMAHALRGLTWLIGLNLLIGFLPIFGAIDVRAHMGGLAAGVLLGVGFDRRTRVGATAAQVVTTLAVLGVGAALLVYRVATLPDACRLPG